MTVIRWKFDYGGTYEYSFPRNPDRYGGDSYWQRETRISEWSVINASRPNIQIDSFAGARRTLRFTSITGDMLRTLEGFYLRRQIIRNCTDHFVGTFYSYFNCLIVEFTQSINPSTGSFPGSGEDTWDLEMVIIKVN